jgi:hypothetical protein
MKTTKLTGKQIEKLAILLANQFMGKTILVGNKYGYNNEQLYYGIPKLADNNRRIYTDTIEISNKQFGKSVLKINAFNYVEMGYNEFYKTINVNVAKLLNFTNGQEVINKALFMVNLQNN